jgi:hypothetical protein
MGVHVHDFRPFGGDPSLGLICQKPRGCGARLARAPQATSPRRVEKPEPGKKYTPTQRQAILRKLAVELGQPILAEIADDIKPSFYGRRPRAYSIGDIDRDEVMRLHRRGLNTGQIANELGDTTANLVARVIAEEQGRAGSYYPDSHPDGAREAVRS